MRYSDLAQKFALFAVTPPSVGGDEGGDQGLGGGGASAADSLKQAEKVVLSVLARAGITKDEVPENVRKVLRTLARENFNYREANRKLRESAPADGAVVLTGDAVALYNAVKESGLGSADALKAVMKERDELKTEVTKHQERAIVTEAAEALNFKPNVLLDLKRSRGLVIEMLDTEITDEAGNKTRAKLPHVKTGADGATAELLSAFAERELKDYLPALKSKADGAAGGGVFYPEQSGGSGRAPSASDVVGKATAAFVRPSKRNNQS